MGNMRRMIKCAIVLAIAIPHMASASSLVGPRRALLSGGSKNVYKGLGDIVPGATAWYGLRAYTTAIAAAGTQKLINVRNVSTSETCDIIVANNGGFGLTANCSVSANGDTAAVFCALGAGSCAVTEVYDQTGGGLHVLQATAANQPPLILNCLNNLPCISGTGTHYLASIGNFVGHAQPYSISAVFRFNNIANNYLAAIDNSRPFISQTASNTIDLNCGSDTAIAASSNAAHAFNGLCSGASSVANVDGTETTVSGGASAFSALVSEIMEIASGFNPMVGYVFEVGYWTTIGFSQQQRNSMCHNQYSYWKTSVAC